MRRLECRPGQYHRSWILGMMFPLNGSRIILTQTGSQRLVIMIVVAVAIVLDSQDHSVRLHYAICILYLLHIYLVT